MHMLQLSAELLDSIATHLLQVDLLNLSLTCKYLRATTTPALFFEYKNTADCNRSFLPFIERILRGPELVKHVRRLELREWATFQSHNPRHWEDLSDDDTEYEGDVLLNQVHNIEPSQQQYLTLTKAAQAAGVITEVFPFEHESYLASVAREKRYHLNEKEAGPYYIYALHNYIPVSAIPYDRKFCQLLRAGVEDPLVVLLLALLPNVKEILLHGTPYDINTLKWKAKHNFKSLQRMTARKSDDNMPTWPIVFFDTILVEGKLEVFHASKASSLCENTELFWLVESVDCLRLQSGTLNLKTLQLYSCRLKSSDLKTLLDASPCLKAFHYTTTDGISPYPSPGKVVELLRPIQHTLEYLYLIFHNGNYRGADANRATDQIISLAHMTALRQICTTPGMWHAVEECQYDSLKDTDLPFERRLSFRLPPSLFQFDFETPEWDDERPSLHQIADIIRMRSELLPNLTNLTLSTSDEDHLNNVAELVAREKELVGAGPHELEVGYSNNKLETVSDGITPCTQLTQWTGRSDPYETFDEDWSG